MPTTATPAVAAVFGGSLAVTATLVMFGLAHTGWIALVVAITAVAALVAMVRAFLVGRYRRRPLLLAIHAAMAYWFFLPAVSDALDRSGNVFNQGRLIFAYKQLATTPEDGLKAIALIMAFGAATVAGEALMNAVRRRLGVTSEGQTGGNQAPSWWTFAPFLAAIFAGFFFYLALSEFNPVRLVGYIFDGRSGDAPWNSTGIRGNSRTTIRNLAIGLILAGASALLALVLHYRDRADRMVLAACTVIALVGVAAVVLESGTRTNLLIAFVPALLLVLTAHAATRPPLRAVLACGLAGLVLVASAGVIRDIRKDEAINLSSIEISFNDNDFYSATMLAVASYQADGPVVESPLALAVVQLVPNRLYPGMKPYPETIVRMTLAKWDTDPRDGGPQMLPSIVGHYLIAVGPIGVPLAGLALGAIGVIADRTHAAHRRFTRRSVLALQLGAFIFLSFRGLMGAFAISLVLAALLASAAKLADHRLGRAA